MLPTSIHICVHASYRIECLCGEFLYTKCFSIHTTCNASIYIVRVLNALPAVQLYCVFILRFVILFLLLAFHQWIVGISLPPLLRFGSARSAPFRKRILLCERTHLCVRLCIILMYTITYVFLLLLNTESRLTKPLLIDFVCGKLRSERDLFELTPTTTIVRCTHGKRQHGTAIATHCSRQHRLKIKIKATATAPRARWPAHNHHCHHDVLQYCNDHHPIVCVIRHE